MTGLPPFQLKKTTNFERSYKKLIKTYKSKPAIALYLDLYMF